MADTWELITTQYDRVLKPFYDQVDKTRKRLNLTPFKLRDPLIKDQKLAELDDVINVTENRSVVYMSRIIAGLMSSKWQGVVEGQVSKREAHKIEEFIDFNLKQGDEYLLTEYGMAGLDAWLCNHVCHTSLVGAQWMCRVEDREYKVHLRPVDMRYTPFVLNKWVAPITYLDKEDLLQKLEEYQKVATDDDSGKLEYSIKKEALKDTNNEVRDYWGEKENELWIEKQLVFRQPNTYSKLPFVITWVPSGFMFEGKDKLAYQSPSLLFLNEQLYDQLSRQLSIDATLGFNSISPAYEREKEVVVADQPAEPAPKRGTTTNVEKGGRTLPVPTADINRAELASREQISSLIEAGGPIAPRAYTTPPSAIEVVTEVELLDQLQNPQIIALQSFKSRLARLMIEQFITLVSGSADVGPVGSQYNFSVNDLKDPKKYTISYMMLKQNRRLALVNRAEALSAWGRFPMKYIFRDILGVEDPDGWERELELQRANEINPAISFLRMAIRHAEEAEDIEGEHDKDLKNWESVMLQHEYVMQMRQRLQPAMPGETQDLREAGRQTGNAQGLIKLLGPGR